MNKPSKLLLLWMIAIAPMAFAAEAPKAKAPDAKTAKPEYIPRSPKLNRSQFDALLANPSQLVVIDLRRPDEVSSKGGFPVYLSIQAGDLEKYLDYIPKDRFVVTVSNHSARSGKSADLLADKGFKVAGFVGAEYYKEEGGTLTKIPVPPPKAKPAKAAKK